MIVSQYAYRTWHARYEADRGDRGGGYTEGG